MGLVTNNKESLHNGVNQQPPEHRLDTQVSEMINCIPTLDVGLRKRNPSVKQELSEVISYPDEVWQHSYDRGLAGSDEEKYSIMISRDSGISIINVNSGKVYTPANGGIEMAAGAADYLYPFVGENGYAAVTIKDTTFLVNKFEQPRLKDYIYGDDKSTTTMPVYRYDFNFHANPTPVYAKCTNSSIPVDESAWITPAGLAPYSYSFKQHHHTEKYKNGSFPHINTVTTQEVYNAAGVTFTIEGVTYSYFTSTINYSDSWNYDGTVNAGYNPPARLMKMNEFIANCAKGLAAKLGSLYKVQLIDKDTIRVTKLNGATFTSVPTMVASVPVTVPTATCPDPADYTYSTIRHTDKYISFSCTPVGADFVSGVTSGNYTINKSVLASYDNYKAQGFIWIKASEPTTGYNYTIRLKQAGQAEQVFGPYTSTTTEGAATAIKNGITAATNLTAVAVGSVVRITTDDLTTIEYVNVHDTFGNQASIGFAHTVAIMDDLPKSLGFPNTIIKVEGTERSNEQAYWVKYDGSIWRETIEPKISTTIDEYTMPLVLVKDDPAYPAKSDFFSLKQYTGWDSRKIGDDNSNKIPSFIQKNDGYYSPIKDIFFFKNRLGFITESTVALSEVGNYGNFFRTTALTVLDSDVIDTTVDSTDAVRMEYALYLEDSVMLFSDKAQFKLEGGAILSPKSVQVSKTSAYEMNKRVRPVFMNNSIFFVTRRGRHSAVMEYTVTPGGDVSEAVDITAHVQTYIPGNVVELSGSSVDNMLFIRTSTHPGTVYVYKYYDKGNQRVQSAWFKWEFNGTLKSAFSFGRTLNMLIMRRDASASLDWILADGIWSMDKLWDMTGQWIMSINDIPVTGQFEKVEIAPMPLGTAFLDSYDGSTGTYYQTLIDFGRWVLDIKAKGIKTKRGHLQFKTVEISSEIGSEFYLRIEDIRNGKMREVPAKYTVGKKPLIMGNADNMNLEIRNWSATGFQINTVSYEGNYVSRNTPI